MIGHFSDVNAGREAMGINWMARDELSEAIPPAYTEFIGRQLLEHIELGNSPLVGHEYDGQQPEEIQG